VAGGWWLVAGGWWLMVEHYYYYSKRIKWAGHVARMGDRRGAYRVLVGKP